jgi:hypothetical protein
LYTTHIFQTTTIQRISIDVTAIQPLLLSIIIVIKIGKYAHRAPLSISYSIDHEALNICSICTEVILNFKSAESLHILAITLNYVMKDRFLYTMLFTKIDESGRKNEKLYVYGRFDFY